MGSTWNGAWVSQGNVLSTELNSLNNTFRTNAGTEVTNNTILATFGKLEMSVTFTVAPSATAYVALYMVTAPGGTNYEDGSNTVDPGKHTLVAVIPVRAITTAQRLMSQLIALQPGKTKFILENQTGQSFPASGSTVVLYTQN